MVLLKDSERQPLLAHRHRNITFPGALKQKGQKPPLEETQTSKEDGIGLKRHITLVDCIGIIIGNVVGSGIFISPKGVLAEAGSVGATLLIWGAAGLYSLAQALCYAELGSVIPKAGGDYAYIFHILGPLPAFMCAWTQIMIVAASSNAVIATTGSLYLQQALGLRCYGSLVTVGAVLMIVSFGIVNSVSSKLGTKVQVLFSTSKIVALTLLMVTGIVQLAAGKTENLQPDTIFEGTSTDPGMLSMAFLNGYFAYKGWELVNTLPEEMVNPKRDLPISVWISMLTVTACYVMTNVAYFSVLSPAMLIKSDAVALVFVEETLGKPTGWVISVAVTLSCMGSINGSYLSDTRYMFAAGRYNQFPKMFSMIHVNFFTPLVSIVMLCIMSAIYCCIPNVQSMQGYASLAVQLKIMLSFVALFYLRWKSPELNRPVKVNIVVVVVTFATLITLIGLGMYNDPLLIGIGILLFLLGLPVYFIVEQCKRIRSIQNFMDRLTVLVQQLLQVVPESGSKLEKTEDVLIKS